MGDRQFKFDTHTDHGKYEPSSDQLLPMTRTYIFVTNYYAKCAI